MPIPHQFKSIHPSWYPYFVIGFLAVVTAVVEEIASLVGASSSDRQGVEDTLLLCGVFVAYLISNHLMRRYPPSGVKVLAAHPNGCSFIVGSFVLFLAISSLLFGAIWDGWFSR